MKKTLFRLILAASLPVIIQTASADVLLTDNFQVSSNSQNVNQELATRQTGPLAPAPYTGWQIQHQVGNTTTDIGQPGGATNSNYVLLAFDGAFFSDVNIASVATGPVTIEFDMYLHGANNPSTDPTSWVACSLRSPGDMFPVCGAGEFAFLVRANGGVQAFQNGDGGANTPAGWDTAGFAPADHWKLIFSDSAGIGSAFNGNGSQVTMINGTTTLGTIPLGQLNSAGLRLGFRDTGNRFGGIANFSISGTPAVLTPPGHNLSFEYDATLAGQSFPVVPTSWTGFNATGPGDFGSQNSGGGDFTVNTPLAAPADGNQFCYINKFNGGGVGGIYQDMGALQPNSIYTLTVAIGSRVDRINSPGIISLINGTDNTGTVLATGGGLPSTQDTWQDYTATFATGSSVSGDLTIMLSALGAGTIQADFDNVRLNIQASVVPLPVRIQDTTPASATVAIGSNVVFTAAFSNSPPVSLQWQKIVSGSPDVTNNINTGVVNVTNSGVVTSTLTLNNAQLTDSGSYRLKAANATNSVTVVYTTSAPLKVISPITWYAAGTYNSGFSDNTVLALAGSVANEAYGVNFGAGALTTANGYGFDDYLNSGNVSVVASGLNSFGGYMGSVTTGDSSLDIMLGIGSFGSAANRATLNNLTVGQAYTVMVLLADTRSSGAGGTTFHLTDGLTVSPDQQYAYANGVPAVGGYIMGTFTAQATTQALTVLNNNGNSQYNAILLEKGIAPPPNIAPTFTTDIHPLLSEVPTGGPVTLSVAASGSLPLFYQWFNQSGPISGATNSSFSFNALAGTNSYHVGVSNSVSNIVSSTAVVVSSPAIVTINNFSFEAPGGASTPTGWTPFNERPGHTDDMGSETPGGSYAVNHPLGAPADGNQFCYINVFDPNVTGGLYQDVGALLPNTTYTLTVAIGTRSDLINGGPNSPGIISLVNGADNTGTLLGSTNGQPDTQGNWQDYTVTFTTGGSVSGHLTVLLSVLGNGTSIQGDFDHVRLTATPGFQFRPPAISGGNLILTGVGGTANTGYTLLTTTNLSTPIWTTNTTGNLDANGAFSNAIPITVTPPVRFFRVRIP